MPFNSGFKGIDCRQTGSQLVFRAALKDSTGAKVTSGTTTLTLYEIQSDGTLKSYDFNSNTFKTTALTTATLAMTHQTGNNGTTNTGVWTAALSTLTGFNPGSIYLAQVNNSGASPTDQEREFQYGGAEGDLVTATNGQTGQAWLATDTKAWLGTQVVTPATSGVPTVDAKYLNGTLQTARDIGANVLLSNGAGTGQILLTAGVPTISSTSITAIAAAVWASLTSGMTTAGSIGLLAATNLNQEIWRGTAQAGSTTSVIIADNTFTAFAAGSQLKGCRVTIVAGTGAVSAGATPSEPKYITDTFINNGVNTIKVSSPFSAIDTTSVLSIERDNWNANTLNSVIVAAIALGAIDISTLTAALKQLLMPRGFITSVGGTTPATAGTYNEDALFNGEPTYVLPSGQMTIWHDPATPRWVASPLVGTTGAAYFATAPGASVTGPYTPQGTAPAIGTPVFTFHGNAVLGEFQPNVAITSGTGSQTVVVNVKDSVTAAVIVGAEVKASGAQAATASTDLSGNATLQLNSGTVTVAITAPGYSSYNPATHTVDGSGHWDGGASRTLSLTMAAVNITPATQPGQTMAWVTTYDGMGALKPGAGVTFRLVDPGLPGVWDRKNFTVCSADGTALLQVALLANARYEAKAERGDWVAFATSGGATFALPEILGNYGS